MKKTANLKRCEWVNTDPIYINYHDQEWGVPVYDDRLLFEFLILEGAQAGLSWITILKRRDHYRTCFDHFNAEKIARYDKNKTQSLIKDARIIRNRLKIEAAIINARSFLVVKGEFSKFSDYLWQFVDGKPIQNYWQKHIDVPAHTDISDKLAKDLKKRGFK